jgi:hypothetical protein
MRLYTKLFLGALAATALFASLAGSASARNLSISNRNIRTVFAPLQFGSSELGLTISCNVTLEGTFHSNTIAKVVNSLVGYITRATADTPNCRENTGGTARALVRQETLPWHIRYVGFIGTLPNVRVRLQLINAGFRILGLPFGLTCNYLASPFGIVEGPAVGSNINSGSAFLRAEEAQTFESGGFGCPNGRFFGRGAITLLGTTTAITVRLI